MAAPVASVAVPALLQPALVPLLFFLLLLLLPLPPPPLLLLVLLLHLSLLLA